MNRLAVAALAQLWIALLLALSPAVAQRTGTVRTDGWCHLVEPGPVDPGLGVFLFPRGVVADSLPLYPAPDDDDDDPIGFVTFRTDSLGGGWNFAVVWPEAVRTNLLETGYESAGLPIDSLGSDGWARVVPGFHVDGSAIRAWTRPHEGVRRVLWSESLGENDLFFRAGTSPAFFDGPAGRPAAFPLADRPDGYIMHVLQVRAPWMRVRVVSPSDSCADPVSPRSAELWIRFLDESGRPLVWYYTRGC